MKTESDRPLAWKADYEVGVPLVDDQHRTLVKMINEAGARLAAGCQPAELEEIVQGLIDYADYHFDTEERYARESSYDKELPQEAAEHVEQHRAFTQEVLAVKQKIADGHPISPDALIGYLRQWLISHILDVDRKLGDFLCAKSL